MSWLQDKEVKTEATAAASHQANGQAHARGISSAMIRYFAKRTNNKSHAITAITNGMSSPNTRLLRLLAATHPAGCWF